MAITDRGGIRAIILLPAPLEVCPTCGEQLLLALSEHADEQAIFHRSELEALIGDKIVALRGRIATTCPNTVVIGGN